MFKWSRYSLLKNALIEKNFRVLFETFLSAFFMRRLAEVVQVMINCFHVERDGNE